jgi:hypothetical protein
MQQFENYGILKHVKEIYSHIYEKFYVFCAVLQHGTQINDNVNNVCAHILNSEPSTFNIKYVYNVKFWIN